MSWVRPIRGYTRGRARSRFARGQFSYRRPLRSRFPRNKYIFRRIPSDEYISEAEHQRREESNRDDHDEDIFDDEMFDDDDEFGSGSGEYDDNSLDNILQEYKDNERSRREEEDDDSDDGRGTRRGDYDDNERHRRRSFDGSRESRERDKNHSPIKWRREHDRHGSRRRSFQRRSRTRSRSRNRSRTRSRTRSRSLTRIHRQHRHRSRESRGRGDRNNYERENHRDRDRSRENNRDSHWTKKREERDKDRDDKDDNRRSRHGSHRARWNEEDDNGSRHVRKEILELRTKHYHKKHLKNDSNVDLREIIIQSRGETNSPKRETETVVIPEEPIYDVDQEVEIPSNHSRWDGKEITPTRQTPIVIFKNTVNSPSSWDKQNPEQAGGSTAAGTYPGQFITSQDGHHDIPTYDGLNPDLTPRQFTQIIDDLGNQFGWRNDERKCQMAAKLQGAPKEWLLKDELMCEPWEKIKSHFIKMHPTDMDYHQQLKKMLDRSKYENESFSNYFTFKTMLMNAVGITGRRAVSCLIGGLLNPNLRKYCYQENFASPDALYAYLNAKGPDADSVAQLTSPKKNLGKERERHALSYRATNHGEHERHGYGQGQRRGHESPSLSDLLPEPDSETNVHDEEFNQTNYCLKHLLSVKIKNNLLDAYNDLSAQSLTITEQQAKAIRLRYEKRRTTIIGFRGVPVLALGDTETEVKADQAVVKSRIYIVPNISQEKPVIIGKAFRENKFVTYTETNSAVSFVEKIYDN